jgi:succinyl-CoA synthetase beta subunit
MVSGIGEVLLGYRWDRDAGPYVLLAPGGIDAELYSDRALRLAPVDLDTAREMIAEVRGLKRFAGYRGRPRGDVDALAAAIVSLSRLALSDDPLVLEAEINPLVVREHGAGVCAVDAVVSVAADLAGGPR